MPPSTFDKMCRAVLKGDRAWQPDEAAVRELNKANHHLESTALGEATGWWLLRLQCFDFMPNEGGVIVADVCTWLSVYTEEYVPECDARGVEAGKRATWYEGRSRALLLLARETYGDAAKPFKLRLRAKNRSFKECERCQALRLAYAEALRQRDRMMARRALADMREHSNWFLTQRTELDRMRRSATGGRLDTVFGQSDACGEDCLNLPTFPRVSSANTGKYSYKIKLQANLFPGFLFAFQLVPPHLVTGVNFGVTSFLQALCNCIDRHAITVHTRKYIHATDGGSENRAKLTHAMAYMLVQYGAFDEVLWCRLPPNHSHDFVDRVFSAIETWLKDVSYKGCQTLWELRDYLLRKFSSETTKYHNTPVIIDILLANYDFQQWLHGCIAERELIIKEVTRADGSKHRPEPLVWRTTWSEQLQRPVVHYKPDMSFQGNFFQSEWGPWEEVWVDGGGEGCEAAQRGKQRVLRTAHTGVQFMHKLPDVRVDPGYESFLTAADWSMDRVMRDVQRVNYGGRENADTKATWATLAEWHGAHQLSSDLRLGRLPVTFSQPHMRGKQLGTGMRSWAELWRTLLTFATRAPHLQANPPPAPAVRPAARAVAAPVQPFAPRLSEVNVVNHLGYTVHEATVAQLLSRGEQYVDTALAKEKQLFWIELDHPHGELCIGLGRHMGAPEDEPILAGDSSADAAAVWVQWYERKSARRSWGQGAVQFKEHVVGYDLRRRPKVNVTFELRRHLLPVVVELCNGCSSDEPKVTKRCREALWAYVEKSRPDLRAVAAVQERPAGSGSRRKQQRMQPAAKRQRNRSAQAGTWGDPDDGSDEEGSEEESGEDSEASEGEEGSGKAGEENGDSSEDEMQGGGGEDVDVGDADEGAGGETSLQRQQQLCEERRLVQAEKDAATRAKNRAVRAEVRARAQERRATGVVVAKRRRSAR